MTRVLRMMSAHEALTLLQGKAIESHLVHADLGNHSDSIGCCFAIDNTPHTNPQALLAVARRVSGLATIEVGLIGIIHEASTHKFKLGKADYNVGTADEPERGTLPEMSATHYRLDDFERWWLYTPEPIPYHQNFKIISSLNWMEPVLTASSIVKH